MPIDLQNARVPGFIRFSAADYTLLAQASRMQAVQAERDAERQQNPGIVKMFNDIARKYRDLTEKCELAARVL